MSIIQQINASGEKFRQATGVCPATVYLGRNEMRKVMEWAERNAYIPCAKTTPKEGARRPEICGLKAYEVNDDNHLSFGITP